MQRKILFLTDIHQNESSLKKINFSDYDAVICGGDFLDPNFPNLKKALKLLEYFPKNSIIVPGNCDNNDKLLSYINDNFVYLHKNKTLLYNFDVHGIGFSRNLIDDLFIYKDFFSQDEKRVFEFHKNSPLKFILNFCGIFIESNKVIYKDINDVIIKHKSFFDKFISFKEEEIDDYFSNCAPSVNSIIVTHSPPLGFLDKVDYLPNIGSPSLTKAIDKLSPKLVLCGHFHENAGLIKYKNCSIFNPGALKDGFYGEIIINDTEIVSIKKVKI
ncbi:MAG TPA: metallophosphoesterase [Spirochaetota bacterium]|nr:metallophosphoesterase [Spirochaetota bacterium]HOS32724.1 metallophosphoesterase [Spirochaetota bacterium]HOS54620.1 metallophosphoesterase [Spirochaetota bacterium]HPK61963.1 metallophosphoesterase [Spirochaetota bacterium]HQF77118.1 metallophosphoesterase [Spirochaetota bacterium]